jgi:hypothetical protein
LSNFFCNRPEDEVVLTTSFDTTRLGARQNVSKEKALGGCQQKLTDRRS